MSPIETAVALFGLEPFQSGSHYWFAVMPDRTFEKLSQSNPPAPHYDVWLGLSGDRHITPAERVWITMSASENWSLSRSNARYLLVDEDAPTLERVLELLAFCVTNAPRLLEDNSDG
jgi:hypothetical protein